MMERMISSGRYFIVSRDVGCVDEVGRGVGCV